MKDLTKEELKSIHAVLDEAWGKDYLIDKIQSMIDNYCEQQYKESESKYNVGQEVWMMHDNEPRCYSVFETLFFEKSWSYTLNGENLRWRTEKQLYATKLLLIEYQIEYWTNKLSEELEYHVSDYCTSPFEGDVKGFNHGDMIDGLVAAAIKPQPYHQIRILTA